MHKKFQYLNYFHFLVLLNLLSYGGKGKYVEITSMQISKLINRSQQTASNILLYLERENLIERIKNKKRFKVKVTNEGYEVIQDIYELVKYALEKSKLTSLTIKGKIVTGMGEGAYYMSLDGYVSQFQEKIGYKPYPGTLNVKIEEKIYLEARKEITKFPYIYIEGFRNSSRSFGWVKCIPVHIDIEPNERIENKLTDLNILSTHMLLLERTHHDINLVELISPYNIKELTNLRNGDSITMLVENIFENN